MCIVHQHQGIKDARKPNADTRKPHPPPVTFAFSSFFPRFANFLQKRFVTLQLLSGHKICTCLSDSEKEPGEAINQDREKTLNTT